MDTRTLLRERLRRSRDWTQTINELEKELEASGTKPEQSERLFELATLVEDIIPERDKALTLYQRAWKLHPDNLKALSRAREVYGEIGRYEMVAKLGEMELRSPLAAQNLAQIVGEAMLDSGQKDKALPILQRALGAEPNSIRVKDALAALTYDAEGWSDTVDMLSDDAESHDDATCVRMLLRAARIVKIEAPDDPERLEELLKRIFVKDLDEPSANFMFETLLAAAQRWDDLERHQMRRVERATDHAKKVETLRMFALEWLQRWKDKDRGAKFFDAALKATASNGASTMKSVIAAFTLLKQVHGDKGEWNQLLDLADAVLERVGADDRLFIALQCGHIAFDKTNDLERAKKYFAIAAAIEPQNPNVQDFVSVAGELPMAAGSMPTIPVQKDEPAPEPVVEAKEGKKGKRTSEAPAPVAEEAKPVETKPIAVDTSMPAPAPAIEAPAPVAAPAVESKHVDTKPMAVEAKPAADIPADLDGAMQKARSAEGGPDKGVAAWKQVIAAHPTNPLPRRELARVLRTAASWAQLVDALKDEEAKAAPTPVEKAAVFVELADAYGKLNNDNQVIASLTQAIHHDPSMMDAYDKLAALYENKKRWPDLVKVLAEKAERTVDGNGKVAIYLQIANLYLERFSNQAEAIKSFEKVLKLDPNNQQAVDHLLQVYEKRRDWEKLIKLKEAEIERSPEAERGPKVIEVARMAATKVKKPDICTYWWEKVVQYEPTHDEALTELYKLYERNKEWDKLADICSRQADAASDAKVRADALQRLGLLYTEKVENSAKAIDAWRRLLEIDENNRRAQDALKKLYVTEGRWEDLEEFYTSRGKVDEYIRVLEREVESGSDTHRLSLAMKIAVLYRDTLQKADRAMRAFEKVLQLDENNLAAAEALIPLYEQGRDPKALVRVLEIQLKATDDPLLRQERMKRLAQYNEEKLRDKGAAFGWWLKAHAEDHESEEIHGQIERLAAETGGWNALVDAYAASLPKFSHREDALPLMLVMARVIEKEQGDVERALDMNRQILAIDERNEQAVDALQRLYLGKGQFEDLLKIYEKKLDLTNDADERIQIQLKIGQLYEDEVKDDKKAIAAYQAILDASGDEPSALSSLDRIYVRNQMWKELADVLGRQITIVGPEDNKAQHVELKYRLGQLKEQHLDDVTGAIDAYRDILDIDVGNPKARDSLEIRLRGGEKHRLTVAGILEPVYEQLQEWGPLVGVHEIQLEAEKDQLRRTALLLRIGELQRTKLLDAEKAFDAYARAFREDPSTEAAKEQLEALAPLIEGGWERLVKLFEGALDKTDIDPKLAHELATKVARSYEDRLGNSAKAVEFFRRVLTLEPDDLAALSALESIFTRDEKYTELLEIYRRRIEIANEPEERLEFLFRSAQILEEMLGAPDEAIGIYQEILGQSPDDLKALRALDRLYVQRQQWRDLGDNISRQLTLVEAPYEQVALLVRLAQLRETHLGEVAAAVETYRQVLDIEDQNRDAVGALERLIANPEHELTIANILEPIYKARGEWTKQIGVYEIMAKHAFDPARKIELLHMISELHEVGGDNAEAAFATFSRAMREDPRNEMTHGQLDRLARGLDKWPEVVALYDQVANDAQEDDLKVALLFRRAQIQEGELGDTKGAVETYERVLKVSPSTVEAATAIQAIHERTGDWPKLVDIIKRKSELLTNLDERKQLLYRAAQIEEEVLGNADAAIATFRQVLSIDDVDMPAMDALERLYVRLARWEPLKDVYAKKADLAEDPDDKKRMLYVLAQVYDRELGDVAKAIETYQGILDLDADELPAIQSLDRLYGQAERWYDLLGNLERQVELAESTGETVALKYRIGNLWQLRLGDVARAIESYREALEMDPSHAETLSALDGLVHGKVEPVMAARVLEPIYETAGEYAKLVDVLEVMVAHNEDPLARVELLHRIAQLHEQMIGNAHAAFDAFARALVNDSGNEKTLGHIERLAEITGTWEPLANLYAAEAGKSLDIPRQVDLYSRLARVWEQELGDVAKAIATYKKISEVEFDNKPAVLALDRLYSATAAWPELAETLKREIQLAEGDGEVAALQFRLGQTLESQLGDRKGAVEVYREILTAQPTHEGALSALEQMFHAGHLQAEIGAVLEPLYEAASEFGKLHGIYEVQLTKLVGADRQAMYQRLAELAETRLYDQSKALSWWAEALVEDPKWERALEESERLAGDTGAWPEMVTAYSRALERTPNRDDKEVRRATLLRLARVYEFEIHDPAHAVETHLKVLEIAPKDPDALAALDRLYLNAGMYDDLAEILRRRIEVVSDPDEQLELYFRRGAIFSDALGDLEQSLKCYQAVLEQESRNRRALEAIESIHFRREDWKQLFETYEKLIDCADTDSEMADIYARMARLCSDALNQEDRAIELLGRVLDIRGEEPQALAALADLTTRQGKWEELVEIIERQIAVAPDAEQIPLYKHLGRVWEEKLGRERNALDAWLAADRIDGNDLETLRSLARLYRSTQAWDELSQTIRRIIDVGQLQGSIDEHETIELYAQLGQLEGDVLGRVDEAVDAWRRVIAIDPSDFRALAALENLFTREGRWEEAIDVLEKRALVTDDEAQRRETLLQAAATWEEKVEDLTKAAAVYERVRASDPSNMTASERLEAIYKQQYKWTELVEILLERSELVSDVEQQIQLLNTVAKIYENEIGDQESAFYVLQAAFKRDYSHDQTAHELERLATATNRWQELLDEYTNRVNELEREDRASAADLWVKIGRWYAEHLSHLEYAIHSVQQALRIDPAHTGALAGIADLQRKRGSWSELIETLQRHAAVEPDKAKKSAIYLDLAELLERQMQDIGGAIHSYQQALSFEPSNQQTLTALDRLYRRTEQWENLIDILNRRAELSTDDQEVIRYRTEIGSIWDLRLFDAGQAITAYQKVLDLDPSNLNALRALETLYEKTEQTEKYLDVLEAQLDASPSDAERVSLYERMAAAWEERFGKLDRAAEALEKIVAIDNRNYSAYRELARLYQAAGKYDALVETYRNHIMATTDVSTRVELYVAMGTVYEQQLNEVDRAIEAYNDVLSFDGDDTRALDALGRLYEKISEWERAIDVMTHLVQLTSDTRKQVDLYWRMGKIQYAQLQDAEAAEANLLRGLALDPGHVPTMEALTKQYSDRGDWLKAAQMMVRAESYTPVAIDKVRLLFEAANIYRYKLRQDDQAKQLYAAVIALDPEHVEAGRPLADLYFNDQQWAELSPVIDMLCRKVGQLHADPRELNELYYRAAKTADELGDYQKALGYYKAAYDIDSTYLPTLVGRADLLFKMQDWDNAGKIYQTILVQHRDGQDEADVVRIYNRLGQVRQNLGERKKALNMFEKALEIDPTHRETLQSVIDLQTAQGDWEAVVHAKRGLMQTAKEKEKVQLLSEIGSVYYEKLQNPQKATAAYLEALEAAPEDHQLLQKILDLYTETKQWKKVVETIERFVALENDPVRRGAYYHAAATICRDELKSLDEAVDYYNKALDSFFGDPAKLSEQMLPRALKSFEAIDKVLTTKRDWKAQERAYRAMLKRLPQQPIPMFQKLQVGLLDGLGEIYRSRLKQYQSAAGAFEIAQSMDPDNAMRADGTDRAEILAELYLVAGPDYTDKAVQQHMLMLRKEPFKYDSYKALRKIYMDSHQYDKTWCVCNTLAFLKKADPDELQFFEQYKPRGLVKAKNMMTPDTWAKLVHPDENRYISAIMGACWQGVAVMKAFPHKDFGIKRKDRRQLQGDPLMFSKLFYYVAQVLNVPLPEVFIVEDNKAADIQLANAIEKNELCPSFVVRPHLLQGKSEREVAFLSARRLTFMRPEYYLKMLLPTNTELKVVVLSAIAMLQPRFPVPPDMVATVQQYVAEMQKRMPPHAMEQLGLVVQKFIQAAPEINLAKWGHAVDAVSHRAGFVVCGDLEVAARMVSAEPVVVGGPQVKDKIKELVLYSISEEFFAVRAQMGLTIAG
jgi:tetratricopeptide (TPR) repeat protein